MMKSVQQTGVEQTLRAPFVKPLRRRIAVALILPGTMAIASAIALAIAGCGVGQSVKDSTVDAAKWAFTTQVKTMRVDLVARSSLNANAAGQSLSTVVRLYQLKNEQTFQQLDYAQLQTNDLPTLQADLLATKDVVLRPGATASITEPMHDDAQFVGIVAFFREPDQGAVWKLAIPKKQWKRTDPVTVEVRGNMLELAGASPAPVTRPSPQQSAPATGTPPAVPPSAPSSSAQSAG